MAAGTLLSGEIIGPFFPQNKANKIRGTLFAPIVFVRHMHDIVEVPDSLVCRQSTFGIVGR